MSEQIVLRCEDSLEGIFTALFDAFVCKNKMKAAYTKTFLCKSGDIRTLKFPCPNKPLKSM